MNEKGIDAALKIWRDHRYDDGGFPYTQPDVMEAAIRAYCREAGETLVPVSDLEGAIPFGKQSKK